MYNGKLIVIEGACDGIGKTTQYNLLKERLEKESRQIVNHHFPTYDSTHTTPVVNYLAGNYGNISDLSPYLINALYAIDRGVSWYTDLKNLLKKVKRFF